MYGYFLWMYVCLNVCLYAICMQCLRKTEEGTRSQVTGVSDSCEPLHGSEIWTLVLWESSSCPSTLSHLSRPDDTFEGCVLSPVFSLVSTRNVALFNYPFPATVWYSALPQAHCGGVKRLYQNKPFFFISWDYLREFVAVMQSWLIPLSHNQEFYT